MKLRLSWGWLLFGFAAISLPLTQSALGGTAVAGWTLGSDGAYSNAESGFVCPKTIGELTIQAIDNTGAPNLLGICQYAGADAEQAQLRVRHRLLGPNEPSGSFRDMARRLVDASLLSRYVLIGPGPGNSIDHSDDDINGDVAMCLPVTVANTFHLIAIKCAGPGPDIDGEPAERDILTILFHRDFVVDCVTRQKKSAATPEDGTKKFQMYCGRLVFKEFTGH